MRAAVAFIALTALCASGCMARDRINPTCEWTHDPAFPVDLQRSAHLSHLVDDAAAAEDLAIRYADATRGHRSGHFSGADEYTAARERCLTTLLTDAATNHGVNTGQVRALLGRRPVWADLAVLMSFGAAYVLAAVVAVRAISRRFPPDERRAALAAAMAVGCALSACGVLSFELWAGTIEMARIGDAHLSYRVNRLPWSHNRSGLFLVGLAVFVVTAAFRAYRDFRIHDRHQIESHQSPRAASSDHERDGQGTGLFRS